MTLEQEPCVGLLMSDLEEAQLISHVFRKIGIIPCYFESLESFWYQTIKDPLALVIVDVLMMSDENFILKDHPMVKDDIMPISFYYSKETSPLLVATYDYFHYGLIQKGKKYDSVLKVILGRVNKVRSIEYDLETIKRKLYYSQMKNNELTEIIGQLKSEQDNFTKVRNHAEQRLKKITQNITFEELLSEVMELFLTVDKFSFLKLSDNRQELSSQNLASLKYLELPILKLENSIRDDEVDHFIHDLALGVALETLGENFRPLSIYEENGRIKYIIFVNCKNKINTFNWDFLEILLNQLYAKLIRKKEKSGTGIHNTTPWQLLSYMDDDCTILDNRMTLGIYVDFTPLIETVKDERDNRFCWRAFMEDFVNSFSLHCRHKFRISHMGIHHLVFLVDKGLKKSFQNSLEVFISRFPFDGYFENEQRLIQDIPRPIVDNLPVMASEYLKLI